MSTEVTSYTHEKRSGCGILVLYNGVFRRRSFNWHRRTVSTNSIPRLKITNSKRRRGGSDETSFLDTSNISETPSKQVLEKPITKLPNINHLKAPPPQNYQNQNRKPSHGTTTTSSSSSSSNVSSMTKVTPTKGLAQGRKVPKEAIRISGELDSMIMDHQRSKGSNTLVRASSSNVMLFSNLGNLRQPRNFNGNSVMGNIVRKSSNEKETNQTKGQFGYLCRTLSKRMDPEELKVMGNEEYKKGRFAEALVLYDRAIVLDPNKASYRSNKSAALTGLGRFLEAVFECREAIRIEPSYHRAHHRLATLYLRLGEAEKALYHFKQSGAEAKSNEVSQAQTLQSHLHKCTQSRNLKDWKTMLKETQCAISSGADSSPQILALQAEALLKLYRHQDADATMTKASAFDVDDCTKFFGPTKSAQLLLIRAQVDMAAGRFEEAVVGAQRAARIDSTNKEVSSVLRRARAVAMARSNGNDLFKASKYSEACVAYGEGLEHDPLNSVVLCNRAACRFKLGQFEKAVEDCTNALNVRPSYSKARLRRADCNAKLERWEASIQDYEMLIRETPGDEEVGRALFEAQVQLKKQRGEDVTNMKFSADVVLISNNERFRHFVTSPGMSVVLFSKKSNDKQALNLMEQLCKRYPSVNFLKVEYEEHPYLAKSEKVTSVPAFKIYKNGSRVKDILGINHELLESSIKFYST